MLSSVSYSVAHHAPPSPCLGPKVAREALLRELREILGLAEKFLHSESSADEARFQKPPSTPPSEIEMFNLCACRQTPGQARFQETL